MRVALALVFVAFVSTAHTTQEAGCKPDTVLDVAHGRDYTITICGAGVIGLRGVEPPLRNGEVLMPLTLGPPSGGAEAIVGPNAAELVGSVGPDAVAYLSKFIGQRVTIVYDGYRMGDRSERRYAYIFLTDKTLLNAEMIRLGYGYADRQGSHPRRDEFIALEALARRAKVGVWSSEYSQKVP